MNKSKNIKAILIGHPTDGKTSLFNALTSEIISAGTTSGSTISSAIGAFYLSDSSVEILDLPGISSISTDPFAKHEQKHVTDYLLNHEFDIIIQVIDINKADRSFYLTTQLIEIGVPVITAITHVNSDDAKHKAALLSGYFKEKLGITSFLLDLPNKHNTQELKSFITSESLSLPINPIKYPEFLSSQISEIASLVYHPRFNNWVALKIIEEGAPFKYFIEHMVLDRAEEISHEVEQGHGDKISTILMDIRYELVIDITNSTKPAQEAGQSNSFIDSILLSKLFGIPILLAIIASMFAFSISFGGMFQDFFELTSKAVFVDLSNLILTKIHSPKPLTFIISEGIGGGMVVVATFIPIIACLFLFLETLQESGYISRAALITNKLFKSVGLNGHAFIPMILGFGCNVPAILATRSLHLHSERVKASLMAPFMSCSARLTVYSLFCSAFFVSNAAIIVFSLYMIGIMVAMVTGLLINLFYGLKNVESAYFEINLSPLKMPKLSTIVSRTYIRIESFIFSAGKTIVMMFCLIQIASALVFQYNVQNWFRYDYSKVEHYSLYVTKAFEPMGLQEESWPAIAALGAGVLAKEVVVATLASLYSKTPAFDEQSISLNTVLSGLRDAFQSLLDNFKNFSTFEMFEELSKYDLSDGSQDSQKATIVKNLKSSFHSELSAFAYLVFVLLYFPCVSVFATIKQEVGTKWAVFSAIWSTSVAYGMAVAVYQVGLML